MNIIKGVTLTFRSIATMACLISVGLAALPASVYAKPSRSTNIALTQNGQKLVAVNVDANSVTVFQVQGGGGSLSLLAEIPVGREPHCVAVKGNNRAYVTITQSGSVWVINLNTFKVTKKIKVGTEPRGCALTPNGNRLFVANHTEGTVSVVDTSSGQVINTIEVGGNPFAIAIDNNRVFVTQLYARLIDDGDEKGEGFDDEKEGVVQTFLVNNPGSITEIPLSPLPNSGFDADRSKFCNNTADPDPVNQVFCPDVNAGPGDLVITEDPQAVFPNQLMSALACGGKLYLPNIGAQPEPPVFFNTNIQALVHVVDIATRSEQTDLHVNLNNQIKGENDPGFRAESLARLFGNDLVAIDADQACKNFFIVSRGGNYVLRARLKDGKLDIRALDKVVRFQTGNIPTGIVVRGKHAYVNNGVNLSVSILDLQAKTVIGGEVSSSKPPEPGSFDHTRLMGKLVFFTALGVPDNGLRGMQIRDVIPLKFRGKQSDAAWSTCASCHFEGLVDRVTWVFADGPRQSVPTDGTFSKINGAHDIRINNWSAARASVTDFNNNSRNVQCGSGFAGGDAPQDAAGNGRCPGADGNAPNPAIFDHGISNGASEALDVETTWIQTVRPLNQPQPANAAELDAGKKVFEDNCASCHGGAKWTKSQVIYANNPALDKDANAGGVFRDRDPGVTNAGDQVISYQDATLDPGTLKFLEDIGTFNAANPIEIRGQAMPGQIALGTLGFNVPSLLSTNYHAPYFHNGQAQTLEDVFAQHQLPGGGTIQGLTGAAALLEFVKAIDGRTATFESQTDIFKDPFRGPCCP